MIILILLFNALRFIGLEISPPGFYADESYGATQVICLWQTGADFFGNTFPLFSISGPGEPIYSPTYLYGQLLWTSIFGHSIAAFRSYAAIITTLTIVFLYLYAKNIASARAALYIAFVATVMPWSWQFSRIAWDPPLAPLFLMLGLWLSTLKKGWWIAGLPLGLAIYSYPPLRIITPLLWLCLPNLSFKRKVVGLVVVFLTCIPLALQLQDENFLSRSNMLTIWSSTFYNPYRHYSIFELISVFWKNWIAHFSPSFLFIHGENNLRHSIQSFGMLSWLDLLALCGLIFLIIAKLFTRKHENIFSSRQYQTLVIGLLGIGISLIPAALTNEASPHALRTISAWPFYALVSGIVLYRLGEVLPSRKVYLTILLIGSIFFANYQYHYFNIYPSIAREGFEAGFSNDILYPRLAKREIRCDELREQTKKMDRNTRIDEIIDFSKDGRGPITSYLNNHWYNREDWGIWSDGKNADLLITAPHGSPKRIIFMVNALITPNHPEQPLEIWVNNTFQKKLMLQAPENNQIELMLPEVFDDSKPIHIEFRTPSAVSPITAGIPSNDHRILGIGLRTAKFKQ
jgi:4-amino-4-deoxy-L-arabinose transferase-like glycosyltransferase